jgi:hypothetical protein
MIGHGLRQWIAEPRPPHVEPVAELAQGIADATGRGMLLVQNDQDRLLHDPSIRTGAKQVLSRSPAILEGAYQLRICRSIIGSTSACGVRRKSATASLLARPATTTRLPRMKPS